MKKKPVFFCDVIIKNRKNPNIIAILRLARNIDYSGFEIANIMKEAEEDKEITKRIPTLVNNLSDAATWNLFCHVYILKKFEAAGFYERNKKRIWTSVFEL